MKRVCKIYTLITKKGPLHRFLPPTSAIILKLSCSLIQYLFQDNKSKKVTITDTKIQQKNGKYVTILTILSRCFSWSMFWLHERLPALPVSMDKFIPSEGWVFPLSPYLEGIRLDKKTSTKAIVWYLLGVYFISKKLLLSAILGVVSTLVRKSQTEFYEGHAEYCDLIYMHSAYQMDRKGMQWNGLHYYRW